MSARVLAYHRVCDDPTPGLETWSVRTSAFRRQMALLKRLGYRGVPLRELLDRLDAGLPAGKLIAITFDDGYQDTVDSAAPILAGYGFSASVYIVPELVGCAARWEGVDDAAPLAGWDALQTLARAGWEIGMHSRSHHPRLDLLTGLELEREVGGGRQMACERLGTPIDTFAYPHGHYSAEAIACVKAAGYRAALTTENGAVSAETSRFALPRYELKRRDTLFEFWLTVTVGLPLRRRSTLSRFVPARWGSPSQDAYGPATDAASDATARQRDAA